MFTDFCYQRISLATIILLKICESYEEILATNNTCFSATSTDLSSQYLFNAPADGEIVGFKLAYNSGPGVTCDYSAYNASYWGCDGYRDDGSGTGTIMITLTYVENDTTATGYDIYPQSDSNGITLWRTLCDTCHNQGYILSSYSFNSDPLIITSNSTTSVSTSDTFALQMCEPACGVSLGDNQGYTCAKVYFLYDVALCNHDEILFTSKLQMDDWAAKRGDTYWKLTNLNDENDVYINQTGVQYKLNDIAINSVCLPINVNCFSFEIFDKRGDGLINLDEEDSNTDYELFLHEYDDILIADGTFNNESYLKIDFCIS